MVYMDSESISEREKWQRLPFVEGDEKAELLLDLCNEALNRKSAAEALALAETAQGIYEKSGAYVSSADIANAYQGIAHSLKKLDRDEEAIAVLGKAIEVLQEQHDPYADNLLRTRAIWCNQSADWESSLESNLEAVRLNEIDGNQEWEAKSWVNTSITYKRMKKYREAIECLLKARQLFKVLKMVPDAAKCDIELSENYLEAGDLANAYSAGTKALHVAQLMQDRVMKAWVLLQLGKASKSKEDFKAADGELEEAYMAAVACQSYEMDWELIVEIQSERAVLFRLTDREWLAVRAEAQLETVKEIIQ